jgi:hypothetical protein
VSKSQAYGKNRTKKYCWLTFPMNGTRNKPGAHSNAPECSAPRRDSPNCDMQRNSVQVGRIQFLSNAAHDRTPQQN